MWECFCRIKKSPLSWEFHNLPQFCAVRHWEWVIFRRSASLCLSLLPLQPTASAWSMWSHGWSRLQDTRPWTGSWSSTRRGNFSSTSWSCPCTRSRPGLRTCPNSPSSSRWRYGAGQAPQPATDCSVLGKILLGLMVRGGAGAQGTSEFQKWVLIKVYQFKKLLLENLGGPRGVWCMTVQFSSVAQSCLILCDPMNRSPPGLPVHGPLLEFTQTHIH